MKKAVLPTVLLFFATGLLWPETRERIRFFPEEERYISIEVLGGIFFMQDENFQAIYGKSVPLFGGEFTYRFPFQDEHGIDISLGAGMLFGKGVTSYTEEETSLRLTDFSFSLCYSYAAERIAFFLGPGMDYLHYKETYAETFPVEYVDGSDTGFHITGGMKVHFSPSLSLKVAFKYRAAETSAPGFRVNLGGTEWNLGIVYRFFL